MIGLLLLILLGGLIGYVTRLDMFPRFTRNDFPDMRRRNSELFGNVERAFTIGNPLSYVKNLATRQFGSMNSRPFDSGLGRMVTSALFCHVLHVVSMRAKKQMGRIDARRIVAMVKHPEAFGNRPIVQFIAEAMGVNKTPVYVKHAVPIGFGGLPKPARLGLDHPRPKSLFWGINMASKVVLDIAALIARVLRHWKGLTAATFAKFDFACGIIGAHKKFTFLVSKPRAFRDAAGHFLLGLLPLHFSTFERVLQ